MGEALRRKYYFRVAGRSFPIRDLLTETLWDATTGTREGIRKNAVSAGYARHIGHMTRQNSAGTKYPCRHSRSPHTGDSRRHVHVARKTSGLRHLSINVTTGEGPAPRPLPNRSGNRPTSFIDQAPRGVLIERSQSRHIERQLATRGIRSSLRLRCCPGLYSARAGDRRKAGGRGQGRNARWL